MANVICFICRMVMTVWSRGKKVDTLLKKSLFTFSLFLSLLTSVQLFAQTKENWNPALTPGGANSMVFKFTKQVWLNPTIILLKQNFEQSTQVKLLLLPRLNGKDTTGSSKLEKAFDKVLSLLVYQENVQGSIKFYFDPQNPAKPFTFATSEELHCKFTDTQKDTVEQLLNKQLSNAANLNDFTAIPFDSIIMQASRYCKGILQSNPGACGPNPAYEFTLKNINSTPAKLNFERLTNSAVSPNGDVDVKKYPQLAQYYNSATDLADNSTYDIAWKAMVAGRNDIIKLKIKKKLPDFESKNLVFKNTSGTETYNTTFNPLDSSLNISISGKPAGTMAEVVGYYTPTYPGAKPYAIGAFNVQFYQEKPTTVNVVLVDLGAAKMPTVKEVQDELAKVYGGVFVNFKVTIASTGALPSNINKNIHIEKSSLLSNYMPDMKPIINHVKNSSAFKSSDKNTYYLLYGCSNDGNYLGYMPRARNIGFMFDNSPHTIAHELGHGAFNLKHIFSSDELGEGNREQTDNLMDYAPANVGVIKPQEALYKHQWDYIHDPSFVGWFEGDDEDAALLANQNYFTPSGLPFHSTEKGLTIVYSKEIEKGNKLNGILYGFTLSNQQAYTAKIEEGKFYGYFLSDGSSAYPDVTNFAKGSKIQVMALNYQGNCQVQCYLSDYVLPYNVNADTYKDGLPIISQFNPIAGKKTGSLLTLECSDTNTDLAAGSIGKEVYTTYNTKISPADTAALAELKRIGALINTLGPKLFNANKQAQEWNNNISSDLFRFFYYATPEPAWNQASLNATYLNIKKYADAVAQFNTLTKSGNFTTTQLKEIINKHFVCCNSFKYLFKAPFDQLNSDQRNNILNVFLNDTWVIGRKSIAADFGNEDVILSTITTAEQDASQHKAILTYLNERKLLYKLVKNVDGKNYEAITSTLTKWILTEFPPSDFSLIKSIKDKKLIKFNDNYFGRRNSEEIVKDNKIVLEVKTWGGLVEYNITCDPYEYIEVTFQNDFSLGNTAHFVKNTAYKLPALYVYLLFNADTKEKWMTTGKISVDVALLAIGAGEIKAAVQAGQWATASLAVADMGIGFADIVINTAFKNEIQTSYPKFFDSWQKVSFCYGIGRIAQVGLTAAYNRCYVESKLINNKIAYSQEAKNTAKQIENKLQDRANFAEFIDESALADELTFFTNVDNHYPSVTAKIGQMDDETRMAFYEAFKKNPDDALQTFEKNSEQLDEWVRTGKVNVAGSFLAKSGIELKTFLNNIPTKPLGKTYNGNWYRYTGDPSYNPTEIYSGMIDAENRFRKGLYLSETKAGDIIEANSYGGTSGKTLFEITNVEINNILDLTDETVIRQLGTSFEQMKLSGVTNSYEYTQEIAIWAKKNGYSGIKFYGAQAGATSYTNFAIFDQSTVNSAIKGSTKVIPW